MLEQLRPWLIILPLFVIGSMLGSKISKTMGGGNMMGVVYGVIIVIMLLVLLGFILYLLARKDRDFRDDDY
ncbi:MAG: hypothetical protein JEZ07_03530 [Phycisphaerae bacterium]|nr:hypothetical protein [Phycisphaerae bacterium]